MDDNGDSAIAIGAGIGTIIEPGVGTAIGVGVGVIVQAGIIVVSIAMVCTGDSGPPPPPDPCELKQIIKSQIPPQILDAVGKVIIDGGTQSDLNAIPGMTPQMRQMFADMYNAAADCTDKRGRGGNSEYNRKRACFLLGNCPNPGPNHPFKR